MRRREPSARTISTGMQNYSSLVISRSSAMGLEGPGDEVSAASWLGPRSTTPLQEAPPHWMTPEVGGGNGRPAVRVAKPEDACRFAARDVPGGASGTCRRLTCSNAGTGWWRFPVAYAGCTRLAAAYQQAA